jgi:hypothetical protein
MHGIMVSSKKLFYPSKRCNITMCLLGKNSTHSKEFELDSFVWNTNMAAMAFVKLVPGE